MKRQSASVISFPRWQKQQQQKNKLTPPPKKNKKQKNSDRKLHNLSLLCLFLVLALLTKAFSLEADTL